MFRGLHKSIQFVPRRVEWGLLVLTLLGATSPWRMRSLFLPTKAALSYWATEPGAPRTAADQKRCLVLVCTTAPQGCRSPRHMYLVRLDQGTKPRDPPVQFQNTIPSLFSESRIMALFLNQVHCAPFHFSMSDPRRPLGPCPKELLESPLT